jgi:two-component system, NarL family, invasion response regulator UvrY
MTLIMETLQHDDTSTTILLADDHAIVRMGFRLLLETAGKCRVVGEAASGEEACSLFFKLSPDVLVIDIAMPGMGGLEAMNRILARNPGARILVLSAHEDTSYPRRAIRAGALGYLSKRGAPAELLQAVKAVARGATYIEPGIAQRLAVQGLKGPQGPVDMLSEREFEVFLHLAGGKSVAQIAELLSLSPRTIGTHLYNIKQKLCAQNAAELTLIALRAGLLNEGV